MANEVLPKPERLNSTKSCEMAALLVTLGFEPADRQMSVATGQGLPGGRLGYWRFLPEHPQGRYDLRVVLKNGLDVGQSRAAIYGGRVVYREQAVIAAAFHNYRMLVENVLHGVRLEAVPMGGVWVLRQREGAGMETEPSKGELAAFFEHGTRNTELAAALVTLGFIPAGMDGATVAGAASVQHEVRGKIWVFPERSADGMWNLTERMARWQDDVWSAQPMNSDPLACCADAFWNLRTLRRGLKEAEVYVRATNGRRSVLVRRDASDAVWGAAERFLTRKG